MTFHSNESNLSAGLPIDDYSEQVKKNSPSAVHECPSDYQIGDLDISCGPLVRFCASHENNSGNYRGSIMIVIRNFTADIPLLSYTIGSIESQELNTGEFQGEIIYEEEDYTFIRYPIEFNLIDSEQRIKYSINNINLSHFQFILPSIDQSMNVLSHSCNGFSLDVDTTAFRGSLWLDVLRKHNKRPYHVMIGGGDQIYADSIKTTSKEFEKWTKHRHLYAGKGLSDEMIASFKTFYLNHYMKWFGKGYWQGTNGKTLQSCFPLALASIPQINIFDDHDIIDGFGSYADITMRQEIFQGVGQYAFRYYMLFQHQTFYKEDFKLEKSFIQGDSTGPYIKEPSRSIYARLGAHVAFAGFDCRTERTKKQVISPKTYDLIFNRLETEITNSQIPIKHMYVLLGIPIMYPRMVWVEKLMESPLSKIVKLFVKLGVANKGLVNQFDGDIELLDDLNDHWCALHHKRERNELLKRLINFGEKYNIRITILSGDVHLCAVSRLKSKDAKIALNPENDPRFITNLISSAILNAPPPEGMANFMKKRAFLHKLDSQTVEDMIPMFKHQPGGNDLFMARRNFADLIPIENISPKERLERYGSETPNNVSFIPGESSKLNKGNEQDIHEIQKTNGKMSYKYSEDSIVATLHIEDDKENANSTTTAFEMLVPSLSTK